jgi:hypothetical protein
MQKTIDIFIKSYHKDFWLLHLALETIKKNVTGYNNLILLIPENEKELFDTRNLPERTLVHYVNEYGSGYLFQQWCKMNAHNYCYADYILFSDSDCFFTYPINLQDHIKDDKPELLYTSWDKVGQAIIWKEPTERFMKGEVLWEGMRRNCLIYHRSTLVAISEYEPNLENMIMQSERWSEFNCMTYFAFTYENNKYNFIDTDNWEFTPAKAEQVWSAASKENGADELHLREYIRILETIIKSFNLPLP